MFNRNMFAAIVLSLFALAVAVRAGSYPIGSSLKRIGPGFFPLLTTIVFGLLSVILLVSSLLGKKNREKFPWPERWLSIVVVMIAVFAYGFFLKYLGFSLSTFLFTFALFKYGYPKRWYVPIFGALVTSLVAIAIFKVWLGTPFPRGFLGY